jgi:soluble lytic murein transglycosylase-like protein
MAQAPRDPRPSIEQRSQRWEPLISESANRYGIDARVLRVVCFLESRFRPGVISPKGARGPMQFMPETAQRYGLQNPHDPKAAIDAAAHYLRDLLMKFGGRVDLALAAYNAGEGTVESFQSGRRLVLPSGKIINPRRLITGGLPPYQETRAYVRSAIALFANQRASSRSRVDPNSRARMFDSALSEKDKGLRRENSDGSQSKKITSSFIEIP